MTKEKYLEQYDSFIEDLKANKAKLSDAEWEALDLEHERFSTELYNKFKPELSTADNIHVKRNQITYIGMRGLKGILDIFDEDLGGEVKESVEELKQLMKSLDSKFIQ